MPPRDAGLVAAVALGIAVLMAGAGAFILSWGEPVILVLGPDGLTVPGLDRPIAWDDIADLDMAVQRPGIVTRILLPPSAPWPERRPGRHAVKLDARRRIVTLPLPLPHKLTPQGFADLIAAYRAAAQARRILAGTAVASVSEPA